MSNVTPSEFFGKLVEQHKFIFRPNRRKKKKNHPDLIGMFRGKGDDNESLYVVYGFRAYDKDLQVNTLQCTISKVNDQNTAQKLFRAGTPIMTAEIPEDFQFEGDDLPI